MALMTFVFSAPVIIFGLLDLLPVIKSNTKKIAFVYIAVATCALVLWTLQARSIHLTDINEFIQKLLGSVVEIKE